MKSRMFALVGLMLSAASFAAAGDTDWPQWRGPQRDGHAAPQELLESWPAEGPALKWQFNATGRGYSAAAAVDGRLYTMGSDEENCFVLCLNLADGSEIWRSNVSRASVDQDYTHGWGGGPRSTPTVDGDQIFVLSDVGVVAALSKGDGQVQWSVDLVQQYGGKIPNWGYSESPLVDGQRVVVTPGEQNFMIALDRNSGEKVWGSKGAGAPAQYVSVIKGTVGDSTFYVTASKPGLLAFDVQSGEQLFADDTTGNDVAVIPTPIVSGDWLYHTSDYGAGNALLKLAGNDGGVSAERVYHLNDKTMRNHHGGVVLVDGVIYGCTKANRGAWMAQDLQSGETLWEERMDDNRSGSICYADGHLYCYNDQDGTVELVKADRTAFQSKGKLTIPQQTKLPRDRGAIWAHPIIADGMLVIRDQDLIFAYTIGKKK